MNTNSKYAAVGTDGMRPVVWGIGDTAQDAEEAAIAQLAETGDHSPLVMVEINSKTAARIEGGLVAVDALGIALSLSQIRDLRRFGEDS